MAIIDTILPRQETKFVKSTDNGGEGYADLVAVVGKAQYSDPNATLINADDDVYSILGEPSALYPAPKIITELFKTREDTITGETINGARGVIYVDISVGKEPGIAILLGLDESDNEYDAIKISFKTAGERQGYSIKVEETGLGYDISIMNGTEIVDGEVYYNVSPSDLLNEITLTSQYFNAELADDITDPILIDKLKNGVVTFTNGSAGVTNSDFKTAVFNALDLIKNDYFDHLCFGVEISKSDLYNSVFITKLKKYFAERQKNSFHSFIYLPNEVEDKTPAKLRDAVDRIKGIHEMFVRVINTPLHTEDGVRSMFESTAAYCGLVCGTPVKDSTGKMVMSDVTSLGVYLEPDQQKYLLKNGITVFERKGLVGGEHRVVSAVTCDLSLNPNGSPGYLREEHVVREIFFALNYINMDGFICSTRFEEATQEIKTFITQKKTELKNMEILDDFEYEPIRDKKEPRHLIIRYKSFTVNGITKVITNEVHFNINLA